MEIFWYIYYFRNFFFGVFWQFTVFTISSSVFIQILWFLARFKGSLKYYQRPVWTEVNRSFKTGLFAVFLFWKWKTRTAGPVFSGLFLVQSRSWIGLKTGLTNTILNAEIKCQKLPYPCLGRFLSYHQPLAINPPFCLWTSGVPQAAQSKIWERLWFLEPPFLFYLAPLLVPVLLAGSLVPITQIGLCRF